MRFTKREKELLRAAFLYCAEVPSIEWLEANIQTPAEEKQLDRLVEKVKQW